MHELEDSYRVSLQRQRRKQSCHSEGPSKIETKWGADYNDNELTGHNEQYLIKS
jgi:hypothetical protein